MKINPADGVRYESQDWLVQADRDMRRFSRPEWTYAYGSGEQCCLSRESQ